MANRRYQAGGGSFNQRSVNPWEQGPPGVGNPGLLGSGPAALPSTNILSTLANPQTAQIALALSNLIQSQTHAQPSNPPSLMSLNTGPPAGFGKTGSFGDFRNDFRRHDNYNKLNQRGRDLDRGRSYRSFDTDRNRSKSDRDRDKGRTKTHDRRSSEKKDKGENEQGENKDDATSNEVDVAKTSEDEGAEKKKSHDDDGDENKDDADKKNDKYDDKDGPYKGVPPNLFYCHVCQKKMWDGRSFDKHMYGVAHKQMMQKSEESYEMLCDMMRAKMRMLEEKRDIELHRQYRLKKIKRPAPRSHCNMCDLEFYGNVMAHRRTASHQKLKSFLHPRCMACAKEFPSRVDWDQHVLSVEHLQKITKLLEDKEHVEKGEIPTEELAFIAAGLAEDDDIGDDDPENVLADIPENCDYADIETRIPVYKKTRPVGMSLVQPIDGFLCTVCSVFIRQREAADQHICSERHHAAFVVHLQEEAKRTEREKRKKEQAEKGEEGAEDDEGNWKRRKVENGDGHEDTANKEDGNGMMENSELYDPSDAFVSADESSQMKNDEEDQNMTVVHKSADSNDDEEDDESAKSSALKGKRARKPNAPATPTTRATRRGANKNSDD